MKTSYRVIENSNRTTDEAVQNLLKRVYVDGGFTEQEVAEKIFAPDTVRARGDLLIVNDPQDETLIGMVIVAKPNSPARQIACNDEAEMHLLAVDPQYRHRGIGALLIDAAIKVARSNGYRKMVLSTQETMLDAQQLYRKFGFARVTDRDWERSHKKFLAFQIQLRSDTEENNDDNRRSLSVCRALAERLERS